MGCTVLHLHVSASNLTLNSSDRKLLPTDAGSMGYLKSTDTLSCSQWVRDIPIQKSHPQVELIQIILLKHRILQNMKKVMFLSY